MVRASDFAIEKSGVSLTAVSHNHLDDSGQVVHTHASVTKQYGVLLSKGW